MEQSDLLRFLCEHLERIRVRYFITGSQATIAFGEPRFTNDIDVVVDLEESTFNAFCDGFLPAEFYLNRETARQELAHRGMFNIIHPGSGLKIDVIIPKDSSRDQQRFERAVAVPIADGFTAKFSSPEDIIVQKMTWHKMGGGERHLRNIEGILKIVPALDRNYIDDQAETLGVSDLWRDILRHIG